MTLTYAERNAFLRSRGWRNYKDYQESVLWANIRLKVLTIQNCKCVLCRGEANQVHHSRYTEANLLGNETDGLHAVCEACHKEVEYNDDKKLTAQQAFIKFIKLLKSGKLKKSKKELKKAKKKHRGNRVIGLAWKRYHQARHREKLT